MYKLLDLYQLLYDPQFPVVCMNEKSKQLISNTREPIRMSKNKPHKIDYEYRRNGTRNIFVAVEREAGRHVIKVTKRRAKVDFARFIEQLLTGPYQNVTKLRLVLDNLNTHFAKSFYEAFPEKKAEELLARVEFYYTPKHASWLNMAEIEIGMLETECIGRRIGSEKMLIKKVAAWTAQVNNEKRKITWVYTKRNAYKDLSKHYVS